MSRCLVLAVMVAACSDPSLRVVVTHPPGFTVAYTQISVYESPAVDCEKIKFGDVTGDQLAAAVVDEERIDGLNMTGDGLSGLSRLGDKFVVARGYDAADLLITAGCTLHKEIIGNDEVAVDTDPAATVSVFGTGDDNDPAGLVVTLTDAHLDSINHRDVAWRVFGAANSAPMVNSNVTPTTEAWTPIIPACTNANGVARLHPVLPSSIGGFATEVRAAWSTEPPRLFSSFTTKPASLGSPRPLSPVANSQRWCAPRASATETGLVCVEDRGAGPIASDLVVHIAGGAAQLTERDVRPIAMINVENVVAVFSVPRGAKRDAYVVTNRARVIGLYSPSVVADTSPHLPGLMGDVVDAILMPACDAAPAQLMMRVQKGAQNSVFTMVAEGGPLLALPGGPIQMQPLALNQAGCVSERIPNVPRARQVGVIDLVKSPTERGGTKAYFPCDAAGGACSITLPVARTAIGFLPASQRMVGAFFDASGTVLSEWVLQPDSDRVDRLVELERFTAASFPAHLVVGDFDHDGDSDLVWDIANVAQATAVFQISYGHKVLAQRLTALSGIANDIVVVDMFAADVDGDANHTDELVITRQDRALAPTKNEVVVIPLGSPIPSFVPTLDTPCSAKP